MTADQWKGSLKVLESGSDFSFFRFFFSFFFQLRNLLTASGGGG